MGKIFCLMGKSSSGKDTIFSILKQKVSLKPIVLYTTRPMRSNEVDGREYHFINEKQLQEYQACHKIIEQRVYNTINGPWHYATIDDGQFNNKDHYIMIVTLEAYINLVKYFGESRVVPIYINVEDGKRLERALQREQQQLNPNYDELCRRFLADNRDFSKENLDKAHIYHYYENNQLQQCIEEIIIAINKNLCTNERNDDI